MICMRRMVRYMVRYIVRYTESQFPPSDLFIMPTDINAPSNILLMSINNIFPVGKWWWTKQYELRPFIMFTMRLDITMLNTAEMRDYYQICITTRLGRITIDLHDDRQTHKCKFVKFINKKIILSSCLCLIEKYPFHLYTHINLPFTSYRRRNVNSIYTKCLIRYAYAYMEKMSIAIYIHVQKFH